MKQNLCIFIGYTSLIREESYGTEISILKLANQLSKNYKIYIVTLSDDETIITDNFIYINYKNLHINVDILIISRYINYFMYCFFQPCTKIYLWVHDITILAYYQNFVLENNGKAFLHNFLDRIDKIIVLSEWHKTFFQSYYQIPDNKLTIIGNGITINNFIPIIDISRKQKNKFIWTSCLNRGIERCIEIIQLIHDVFPDTELHIFRNYEAHQNIVDSVKDLTYIHFHNKVTNEQIIEEFKKSEYWFYPTTFNETYCISALEAQMAGCIAISTDVASLNTTVGDHGFLIKNTLSNKEIAEEVISLMNNHELKNKLRKKGEEWAKKQDWGVISKKWIKLFKYKKYLIF
jgi:glycosyltransferase involved in cell wall biosynthesis